MLGAPKTSLGFADTWEALSIVTPIDEMLECLYHRKRLHNKATRGKEPMD